MAMVFRCRTLVSFDPSSGNYVHCDTLLNVSKDLAGGLTECPGCGELVGVPEFSQEPAQQLEQAEAAPAQPIAKRSAAPAPAATSGAATTRTAATPATSPASRASSLSGATPAKAKSGQSSRDTAPGFADRSAATASSTAAPAAPDDLPQAHSRLRTMTLGHQPCRICRTPLPPATTHCTRCGAPRRAIMGGDMELSKMKVEPAGFMLSLEKGITSGLKLKHLGYTAVAVIVALSILTLGVGLQGSSLLLGVNTGILIVTWCIIAYYWRALTRLATVPAAELGLFVRPAWHLVALVMHLTNWNSRGPIDAEDRLDLRGPEVTDETILNDKRITRARYIDLRRSKITDLTLISFRGFHRLRFLRLNRTQVSTEQVFRLQQTIPKCWIWW